jgi:hypothetical protein
MAVRGDTGGASGIDFNYGAAPDLQLTATIPGAYDFPAGSAAGFSLGNVELAAKYQVSITGRYRSVSHLLQFGGLQSAFHLRLGVMQGG